jgi:tRNA (guanine37-N1)-methyltransferase
MRFDVLTIFPEAFNSFCKTSIIGRALQEKKVEINFFDIREFTKNKHRKVDDVPFGGGGGMLMTPQPLFDAIEYVKKLQKDQAPIIYFSPSGDILNQEMVETYANNFALKKISRVILLCGHYEGIDERVKTIIDCEISIGNFVLTSGDLAAQIFIDAVARLKDGVLGSIESANEESFSKKLDRKIEYPHFTRPAEFRGMKVPDVLLSGHHAEIQKWRMENCKKTES